MMVVVVVGEGGETRNRADHTFHITHKINHNSIVMNVVCKECENSASLDEVRCGKTSI